MNAGSNLKEAKACLTCRSRTCSWILSETAAVLANMRTPDVRRSSRCNGCSSLSWCSLPRIKMTVLCRKRPQGWTGMEEGLSTTTTSSFSASRQTGCAVTGGSCLCTVFRKKSLSCEWHKAIGQPKGQPHVISRLYSFLPSSLLAWKNGHSTSWSRKSSVHSGSSFCKITDTQADRHWKSARRTFIKC